ncbi:MAG: C25 family cysteine peptidase [Pyrinomonadaceae bacterium]
MRYILAALLVGTFLGVNTTSIFAQRGRSRTAQRQKVGFDQVRALSDGTGAVLVWKMRYESGNIGFFLYRLDNGQPELVSDKFVPSAVIGADSVPSNGEQYFSFDPQGEVGSAYYIECITRSGKRMHSGIVTVEYSLEIEGLTGYSSAEFLRQHQDARPFKSADELKTPQPLTEEIEAFESLADIGKHRWVVSQPGVKIGVRAEGLYRVTRAELAAAGFNVNSDPTKWQLYTEGVEQAVIVSSGGTYLEFYGTGINTIESDTRTYYLVSGPENGKRMGNVVARAGPSAVQARNYDRSYYIEENIIYLNDVINGEGNDNYFGRLLSSTPTSFTFDLTGIDSSPINSDIEVKFQGFTATQHTVNLVLNGHTLDPITGSFGLTPFGRQYTIPTSFLVNGVNSLQLSSPAGDFSNFDSIRIDIARKYRAIDNQLSFYTQDFRVTNLEGFSSGNIRIFDVTHEGNPAMFTNLTGQADGSLRMPAQRGRLSFAVEASAVKVAASIKVNTPSTLSTLANDGNLIIITHSTFRNEAEAWATYRRNQGVVVKVVDIEDVFDEFGYGVGTWTAIRDFLQYAKGNWNVKPNYVLLIGDSTFDPRNYEGVGKNYISTRFVDTIYTETPSDDGIVDFNGDGLAELAIGRIPARTVEQVSQSLVKVDAFEQSVATQNELDRGALFAYDRPDGYDFEAMSGRMRDELPAGTPNTMVGRMLDNSTQPALIAAMNTGKYLVNYSGHGTAGAWVNGNFFANSTVPQLTNANNRSVYTMLTCLNGYFVQLNSLSLAENLIFAQNGGAVASWASSGKTTPNIQEVMGTRFYDKIGGGTIPRLGDLILDAKTVVPGGTDVRLSWVLLGDPMLKVR